MFFKTKRTVRGGALALSLCVFHAGVPVAAQQTPGPASEIDLLQTNHSHPTAAVPFGMVHPGPYAGDPAPAIGHTGSDIMDILLYPGSAPEPATVETGVQARPGYYTATLPPVRVEVTATPRVALHRYTFDANGEAGLVVALRTGSGEGSIRVRDRQTVDAQIRNGTASLYARIVFSVPFADTSADRAHRVRFRFASGRKPLLVKVALSSVDTAGAAANLAAELPGWDFDAARKKARDAWGRELSKIEVSNRDPGLRSSFYASLYRCFLRPCLYSDADGRYRDADGGVDRATGFDYYTPLPLQNTYGSWNPLLNLIDKERAAHFVKTFIRKAERETATAETGAAPGSSVLASVADAILTGNWKFDLQKAQEAMKKFSEARPRPGLPAYLARGYVSAEDAADPVVRTVQYAFEDWCVAGVSGVVERRDDEKALLHRSRAWINLFDPVTRRLRSRFNGDWMEDAVAPDATFAVTHDLSGLFRAMGGERVFENMLDSVFLAARRHETGGVESAPGALPYLYNYVSRPGKTQDAVRLWLADRIHAPHPEYADDRWFVFAALGFYPVTPGTGLYALSTPQFDTTALHLENGRTFTITANNPSAHAYIDTCSLRGMAYYNSYLMHNDILMGGTLAVHLTDTVTGRFGNRYRCFPVAAVKGPPYLPAPVIHAPRMYFDKRVVISMIPNTAENRIDYLVTGAAGQPGKETYTAPFSLEAPGVVEAFTVGPDGAESPHVHAEFIRLPHPRWQVRALNETEPPYTCGGPEALVDGLSGDTTGQPNRWLGVRGDEMSFVVDLGASVPVHRLAAGFLYDPAVGARLPGEVVYYLSDDGLQFNEALRLPVKPVVRTGSFVKELEGVIRVRQARFVKMVARSPGDNALMLVDELQVE